MSYQRNPDRRAAHDTRDYDESELLRAMIRRAQRASEDGVMDALEFMAHCERLAYGCKREG